MAAKTFCWIILLVGFHHIFGCASTNKESSEQAKDMSERLPIEGIWTGEFDIGGRGPYDFTAVHIDGHAFAYSQNAKAMCVGTAEFDGENFISRYALFALDGGPFDTATITGKLKEDTKLYSHFVTSSGGDTGALNIEYDPIYDESSSLELTVGNWIYIDRDDLTTEFSIDEEGTISGEDSDSCEYLGYIDVINSKYNTYKIIVEITECGSVSGEYEGVSFLRDNKLNVQLVNKKYALFFDFDHK